MAHSENELELLEEYLDGALDADALAKLNARLVSDRDLSSELVLLKSQRAVRMAALQSMEPDSMTTDRLIWRVQGAMHDQKQKQVRPAVGWNSWRIASIGSAAAACMVLGIFIGRASHGVSATPQGTVGGIASALSNPNASLVELPQVDPAVGQSQFVAVNHAPQISVPVTNEYGQVVAWQNFDNSEQAKNFTEELHRAHGESAPPASNGATRLVDQEQVPF